MSHTAFFYGTLMAPAVLYRVILGPANADKTQREALIRARQLSIRPAILPNYRRHRVVRADYPAITENTASEVRGSLVTGLTDGDIWRLDCFEGSEYTRQKVKVQVLKEEEKKTNVELPPSAAHGVEEEVEAETYVWVAGIQHLETEEWDFQEFVKEKMWRWVDLGGEKEGEYSELDDAVAEQDQTQEREGNLADPTRGRGPNGAIAKALQQAPILS